MEFITWLVAALFGAGVMYLLDPQQGKARRGTLRDQLLSQAAKWREGNPPGHDLSHPAGGKPSSPQESGQEQPHNNPKQRS